MPTVRRHSVYFATQGSERRASRFFKSLVRPSPWRSILILSSFSHRDVAQKPLFSASVFLPPSYHPTTLETHRLCGMKKPPHSSFCVKLSRLGWKQTIVFLWGGVNYQPEGGVPGSVPFYYLYSEFTLVAPPQNSYSDSHALLSFYSRNSLLSSIFLLP